VVPDDLKQAALKQRTRRNKKVWRVFATLSRFFSTRSCGLLKNEFMSYVKVTSANGAHQDEQVMQHFRPSRAAPSAPSDLLPDGFDEDRVKSFFGATPIKVASLRPAAPKPLLLSPKCRLPERLLSTQFTCNGVFSEPVSISVPTEPEKTPNDPLKELFEVDHFQLKLDRD